MLEIVIPYFSVKLFDASASCRRCLSSVLRNVRCADAKVVHFVHRGELDRSLSDFVARECKDHGAVLSVARVDEHPMRCMSVYETLVMHGIESCVSDFVVVCSPWWICNSPFDVSADIGYMESHPRTEAIMFAGSKRKGCYSVRPHDGYDECMSSDRQSPYIYDPTSPHLMRRRDFVSGGRHQMDMTGRMYPCSSHSICKETKYGTDGSGAVLCHHDWKFYDSMGTYRKHWGMEDDRILYRIVVPYYNVYKYIGECLKSIAGQTIADRIRVVICDDASNPAEADGLTRKLDESGLRKENVVLVRHKTNKGLAQARNTCLAYFTECQYTMCLDSDDKMFRNDAMEIIDGRIKEEGFPDVVVCGWANSNGVVHPMPPRDAPFRDLLPDKGKVSVCAWCKCVRTEKFPEFNPEQALFEDMDWAFRLYNDVDTMVCIPEPMVYYRISDVSVQRSSVYDNHYRLSMYLQGMMNVYKYLYTWRLGKNDVRESAFRFFYYDVMTNLRKWGKLKI